MSSGPPKQFPLQGTQAVQSPQFVADLASADCRTKDVCILAVIIAELKFRDVQRHIFGADFVEATNNPA